MNKHETFVREELKSILQPDEQIEALAILFTYKKRSSQPEYFFYTCATGTRLVLLQTEMGFVGVKRENQGVTEIPFSEIAEISIGRSLAAHSIDLTLKSGEKKTYMINKRKKELPDTKQFIDILQRLHGQTVAA